MSATGMGCIGTVGMHARWLAAATLIAVAGGAAATDYPKRPIRFVLGFAPGGASDIVSRIVGQKLGESIGQSVVIDNRPAATGTAAAVMVAKAAPDGYTMLCGATSTLTVNPSLYRNVPYDTLRDFTPVAQMVSMPNVLVVNPSVTVKSVSELIALARAEGGKLQYASAGVASSNHMAAELFAHMAQVRMQHIPYKGGGPALVDVLGGQVPVIFATIVSGMPYVKSGKLRPLGVTSAKRSASMPDVPTIAEAGVPGYESSIWYGVLLPARTPPAIVKVLNAEVVKALASADVKERFLSLGADPVITTPEQFSQYIRAELKKWTKVVHDAGIKGE